jgi:hypothetical protein
MYSMIAPYIALLSYVSGFIREVVLPRGGLNGITIYTVFYKLGVALVVINES